MSNRSMHADVLIIGGGPSGITIAQAIDMLNDNVNEIIEEKCSKEKQGIVLTQ